MRKSKLKLSHVMPNTWFYKIRDMTISTSLSKHKGFSGPFSRRRLNSPESAIRRSFELSQRVQPFVSPPLPSSFSLALLVDDDDDDDQTDHPPRERVKMDIPSRQVLQHGLNTVHGVAEEAEEEFDTEGFCQCNACLSAKLGLPNCQCGGCFSAKLSLPISSASSCKNSTSGSPKSRSLSQEKAAQYPFSANFGPDKGSVYHGFGVVVRHSYDPEKDFRDSMVEMILQKNLTSCEDLLMLLEWYLLLNSSKCHHTIVGVFAQVCLDLAPFLKHSSDFVMIMNEVKKLFQ